MRWSIPIGRIFGIPVELHVTFLLFVAWIAIAQGMASGDLGRALATAALMVLVFACVLLHELGHALAARRYGIATRDIILLPIGGVARLERMPEKPQQEIVVALAGPAVNVAIAAALLAWFAVRHSAEGGALDFRGSLLAALFSVNVVMVLFNLIPAFPMDGGRVLRAALAMSMPFSRATRIASMVGQGIALLFGAFGLFSGNLMLMFVALFVFLAAGEERAVVQTRDTLAGVPVRDAMVTEFRVLEAADPLARAVEHLMAGSQADFPVLEGGVPAGVLTRDALVRALQRGGSAQPVGLAMTRGAAFADAAEPLESAVQRMREAGHSALPVLEHGRLVGLLTLENVGDLLVVREAMRRHAAGAPLTPA
uniref:Zinc metalloprotease n=1 Tax=Eiseniibacteriota bacterium TaxID=2212470 RepID=A0A832MKH8_UNCEI